MIHLTDNVEFFGIGDVDVSTRWNARLFETPDAGWETCVFFENGSSMVVANYDDAEAAVIGHNAFVWGNRLSR